MTPVFQAWVFELPFRMQSVLVSALRGCDGRSKNDPSKPLVRALRATVMIDADPTNGYMRTKGKLDATAFLEDLDGYPVHFVMHLLHAAEIVGYEKPDPLWLAFYQDGVRALHLNPETKDQLHVRLGFTPEERPSPKPRLWDAGTGTSHRREGYSD